MKILPLTISLLLGVNACPLALADPPKSAQSGSKPVAKCEIATVNPVTNVAECMKPRGAPVDPPPPRPSADCQEGMLNPATGKVDCLKKFNPEEKGTPPLHRSDPNAKPASGGDQPQG